MSPMGLHQFFKYVSKILLEIRAKLAIYIVSVKLSSEITSALSAIRLNLIDTIMVLHSTVMTDP